MNFKRVLYRLRNLLLTPLLDATHGTAASDVASQFMLKLMYQQLARSGGPLPPLAEVGFKVYSQTDEDGILLFIFALLGAPHKRCVEICAGNGIECNTANLIIQHGWTGLLVDGNPEQVAIGQRFYERHRATYVAPPQFIQAWVTRTNINDLLRQNGWEGEIDLLSLDMDGVDYWIWEAINVISPRVVVLEYNHILGPERAWTVPYVDNFDAYQYPRTKGFANFFGASLLAFVNLARHKNYRLVGVSRYNQNAFFVHNDLAQSVLPEVSAETCFNHPISVWSMKERFPLVQDLPWVKL